jgi:2-polyprenyl-3-methyl-5-hydroxy-6-metoxy-1,4-benzoquinol methylase
MYRLDEHKKREFIKHLELLNVDELDVSDYNKIYLKKHLESLTYSVNLAWQILELGLNKSDKTIEKLSVVEIGGGTGIISLLAKWLGFGKVIYSDTFEQSCRDFEVISTTLKLKTDDIVCGSSDEISRKYKNRIDLIVSRDVIEHIYNPALFFKQCAENFRNAILVHNTSANSYNIFKKKYFKKIHKLDEWDGNSNQFKPGDSVESFYKMRLDFITKNFPNLSASRKEVLAAITRGKIFLDIKKDVEDYLLTEKLPALPKHPTNTCDPSNGNWTEHLLSFEQYESFVEEYDYKTQWHFAPYDEWRNKGLKRIALKILNLFIKNSGKMAKLISPAIIMVSVPKNY